MFRLSRPDLAVFSDEKETQPKRWKGIIGASIGAAIPLFLVIRYMDHGWIIAIVTVIGFVQSIFRARRRATERAETLRPRLDFGPEPDAPRAARQAQRAS
jgi:hypothetical protein